jgi:hypothetical protein
MDDARALEFSVMESCDLFACHSRLPFRFENLKKVVGEDAPIALCVSERAMACPDITPRPR